MSLSGDILATLAAPGRAADQNVPIDISGFPQDGDMSEQQRILVVEDDPLVSEVISAALDDTYSIAVVETASEAMVRLQEGGFCLMLLDCTLPGGVDDALIPAADRTGTAVILMSGDPGRMAKLTDQPRPFVLKPFTLSGLLDTVTSVLSSPRS